MYCSLASTVVNSAIIYKAEYADYKLQMYTEFILK